MEGHEDFEFTEAFKPWEASQWRREPLGALKSSSASPRTRPICGFRKPHLFAVCFWPSFWAFGVSEFFVGHVRQQNRFHQVMQRFRKGRDSMLFRVRDFRNLALLVFQVGKSALARRGFMFCLQGTSCGVVAQLVDGSGGRRTHWKQSGSSSLDTLRQSQDRIPSV